MSVVKATLIFSIATYLDVILNPLMGFITDSFYRTKLGRKFGRRRFFILTGIPLMLLHRNAWQGFTTAILLYRCKIVIDELDRVHAGGRKEDVSEETRNVIEKLTGINLCQSCCCTKGHSKAQVSQNKVHLQRHHTVKV